MTPYIINTLAKLDLAYKEGKTLSPEHVLSGEAAAIIREQAAQIERLRGAVTNDDAIERYQRALGILYDTLCEYADPGFYHAVLFMADRPAGGFADDLSVVANSDYDREMPGALARKALDRVEKEFGELVMAPNERSG